MREPQERKSAAYEAYLTWVAEAWKNNLSCVNDRYLLPDGVTTYREYRVDLESRGRTPLPYDCLWEPGDD